MSMYKSKPEFKRMPQVQQYYDLEETIGIASRKKYLEDMKLRIEEAQNRGKTLDFVTIGYNIRKRVYIKEN